MGFVQEVARGKITGLVQPFVVVPERGIKDFAGLYTIDEPSTEILLRNAEAIVEVQTAHEVKDGKVQGKNGSLREFLALLDPKTEPTLAQLETAVQTQFKMALGRTATADEVKRFVGLYESARRPVTDPEPRRPCSRRCCSRPTRCSAPNSVAARPALVGRCSPRRNSLWR